MDWLVFTCSLPSESRSSPRVTLWRRLRRLGALSIAGGAQVLPAREECREAFDWLAQEVRQAGGEALVMSVAQFTGISDAQLVDLFQRARSTEYEELAQGIAALEQTLGTGGAGKVLDALQRLRRQYDAIARIDYFGCPAGAHVAAGLARAAQIIAPPAQPSAMPHASLDAYRDKRWVTRPHPYVDRLACIWLIRRYVNPQAAIRYALVPEPEEVSFDMEGGDFSHRGQLCTFEVLLCAFDLDEPALRTLAEIVHEIDLHDETSSRPEIAGIERLIEGWARSGLPDAQLQEYGLALFDGLYQALRPTGS
jgi:hypothetical protein